MANLTELANGSMVSNEGVVPAVPGLRLSNLFDFAEGVPGGANSFLSAGGVALGVLNNDAQAARSAFLATVGGIAAGPIGALAGSFLGSKLGAGGAANNIDLPGYTIYEGASSLLQGMNMLFPADRSQGAGQIEEKIAKKQPALTNKAGIYENIFRTFGMTEEADTFASAIKKSTISTGMDGLNGQYQQWNLIQDADKLLKTLGGAHVAAVKDSGGNADLAMRNIDEVLRLALQESIAFDQNDLMNSFKASALQGKAESQSPEGVEPGTEMGFLDFNEAEGRLIPFYEQFTGGAVPSDSEVWDLTQTSFGGDEQALNSFFEGVKTTGVDLAFRDNTNNPLNDAVFAPDNEFLAQINTPIVDDNTLFNFLSSVNPQQPPPPIGTGTGTGGLSAEQQEALNRRTAEEALGQGELGQGEFNEGDFPPRDPFFIPLAPLSDEREAALRQEFEEGTDDEGEDTDEGTDDTVVGGFVDPGGHGDDHGIIDEPPIDEPPIDESPDVLVDPMLPPTLIVPFLDEFFKGDDTTPNQDPPITPHFTIDDVLRFTSPDNNFQPLPIQAQPQAPNIFSGLPDVQPPAPISFGGTELPNLGAKATNQFSPTGGNIFSSRQRPMRGLAFLS